MWNRLCRSVDSSAVFLLDLWNFQFPLRIRKAVIWTPKMTAAVESEAAKFSMLWFSLPWAAPVPIVEVGEGAAVLDILWGAEGWSSAGV